MTFDQVLKLENNFFPIIKELYNLEGYKITPINAHDGGRNICYSFDQEGSNLIVRISYLNDRTKEDYLGEMEYIRYLYDNGARVANVINSQKGNLIEELIINGHSIFVSVFKKAKGKKLVENNYLYKEGVPISQYYYDCGKVLGKIHQLSKEYNPTHKRYSFFDKYNIVFINKIIPDTLSLLKLKIVELLMSIEKLEKDHESFGMIHFDFNDGNYFLDYDTGQITVFDFDNSCFGWYMYDLADLWRLGMGRIQFEQDPKIRKKFMDDYFKIALEGYKSETDIENSMLEKLPLFIKVTLMENIIDDFECQRRNNDEELECDEWLLYCIKCLEDDIDYMGFFDEIYSADKPFEYQSRNI